MLAISSEPYIMVSDVYDHMKQKTQNEVRYTTYFSLLWDSLLEMFEWENLPDTIPKRFLESILHSEGEVFVSRINGDLIASSGTLSGDIDAYGLGTDAIAVCPVGETQGKRGKDIAYGINNDTATPDMLVYWISHLLGETDKSIKNNVIFSRFLNIPKVADEKDKNTFEEIFKKLKDGDVEAFVSANALDLELGAGTETFQLTDPNKIDKLPYLTQFFEDALKRFYNFYGQPMQNQNKRAQTISDEIHGADSVSFIIPSQMLKCRQALASEINAIFGTDIKVNFSKLWLLEYEALVLRDTNENGIPDDTEPIGSAAEPIGSAAEPIGSAAEPIGSAAEPIGTESEHIGTKTEPYEPTEPEENLTDLPAMDTPTEVEPSENEVEPQENDVESSETDVEKAIPDDVIQDLADALEVDADEIRALLDERKESEDADDI